MDVRHEFAVSWLSRVGLGLSEWFERWFPDAFAGTMVGLLRALESDAEPDIWGRDNLRTIALCEAVLAAGREHRVTQPGDFTG